jgi:hypothetical protein
MERFIQWPSLIIGCMAMVACTSMQSLPVEKADLQRELHPGDRVDVSKVDGRQLMFNVENIDKDGLHGPGINVPFGDIHSISREETSWWRTGLIVLGVVAGGVAVAAASKGSGGGGKSGGW